MKNEMIKQYQEIFHASYDAYYFSPGRVNLIGEHIDYNGGYVMPAAISLGTHAIIGKRDDMLVQVYSNGFSKNITGFDLNEDLVKQNDFLDYIKGVFYVFNQNGYEVKHGFNLYLNSNMPTNAGLSSSASIEVLIATILNDYFNYGLSKREIAVLCQKAENVFVGVNSGIMDQFSVANGTKDHAILLDTSTLKYVKIPIHFDPYQLVIMNSNKKRSLTESKYNERYSECQEALSILKQHYQISNLCELKTSELPNIEKMLKPLIYKRVKHVLTEQGRTLRCKEALDDNNVSLFASLLIESHESLQYDYEVTGYELDTLFHLCLNHQALGARMTGAGFGGCVIALVLSNQVIEFIKQVGMDYQQAVGYQAEFLITTLSDGTYGERLTVSI